MKTRYLFLIVLTGLLIFMPACKTQTSTKTHDAYKTLIITGQNNHEWKISSPILKQILDETGLFSTEIIKTPDKGGDMNLFNPDFSKYRLVVLDYNGDTWSDKTKKGFVDFVSNGGGLVIYHAANNSFPEWKEFNEMTGLGGWGNRSQKDGPYVYYKNNQLVTDTTAGNGGSHGKRREFLVVTRINDHPIMKGLPVRWLHGTDELYSQLRGPARNLQILTTAFADSAAGGGTMRDEPILMTITYGKGRIFHTVMGHADEGGGPAMQCAGFITTFQRGAEWAVTGNVTQTVPFDFPTAAGVVLRKDFKEKTIDEALAEFGTYDIGKSTLNLTCLQNYIRSLSGDKAGLLSIEKKMVSILDNKESTLEAKKLLLRELSWMGSSYSVPSIKKLTSEAELKDEAEFAIARLQSAN